MNDAKYWGIDTSKEIEHHGVKNQKWGIQNGPPYPLNRNKDGSVSKEQREKKSKNKDAAKKAYYLKERAKTLAEKQHIQKFRKKEREEARKKLAAKTEKISARQARREARKAKRLAKKKSKIANDPKALYKNRELFTKEELKEFREKAAEAQALKEFNAINRSNTFKRGVSYIGNLEPAIKTLSAVYSLYNTYSTNKRTLKEKEAEREYKPQRVFELNSQRTVYNTDKEGNTSTTTTQDYGYRDETREEVLERLRREKEKQNK